jgi:hypothetical protein
MSIILIATLTFLNKTPFVRATNTTLLQEIGSTPITDISPLSTPRFQKNGTWTREYGIPAAPTNHWWLIDYWDNWNYYGSFTAVGNSITGLSSLDELLILPLNLAYGTSSTNWEWFQFDIDFDGGGHGWANNIWWGIWNVDSPGSSDSDYHPHTIGLPYTIGHAYHYQGSLVSDNFRFQIWDDTAGTNWYMDFSIPSTNQLYLGSAFSPASALEGYTTPSTVSNVPYYEFTVGYGMASCTYGQYGSGLPSGLEISQQNMGGTPSSWHWEMTGPSGGVSTMTVAATTTLRTTITQSTTVTRTTTTVSSVTSTVVSPTTQTQIQSVTVTQSETVTQTLTRTQTNTVTSTQTNTVTQTQTNTQTQTQSVTVTQAGTVTQTDTVTESATITQSGTMTQTNTVTLTQSETLTQIDTETVTETNTVTQGSETVTQTETVGGGQIQVTGQAYVVIGAPLGSLRVTKPAGTASAAWIDATAASIILGMIQSPSFTYDVNGTAINQGADPNTGGGQPQVPAPTTIIMSGGPLVNGPVAYYENDARNAKLENAPVYFYQWLDPDTHVYREFRKSIDDSEILTTKIDISLLGNHLDYFLIESFHDADNNQVVVIYGYTGYGTFAGALYFKTRLFPAMGNTLSDGYQIVQWYDSNANGFVDTADSFTFVGGQNWPVPP